MWAATVVAALSVAASALGLILHGRSHSARWRWGWSLLTLGLVALVSSSLASAVAGGPDGEQLRYDVLSLAGQLLTFAGLLTLGRHRQADRLNDVLFEALGLALSVGLAAWALVVAPTGTGLALKASAVGAASLDLALLWALTRLVSMTGTAPAAYRYLLASLVSLFTVDAIEAGALAAGTLPPWDEIVALELWAYCL